jgi:hypothetical protein
MEVHMKTLVRLVAIAALLACTGAGMAQAADPMEGKEAEPRLKERILQDAVKGDVLKLDGEYLTLRDDDGKEVRLHVDKTTKMDKVMTGDRVKAYITEKGHVTTLKRIEK